MLTKQYHGTIIPPSEMPDGMKSASDDYDIRGYASVEKIDRDGDIVRIDGIDLSNHRPPQSPIRLLAGHMKTLPDGTSPIIGYITSFQRITHKSLGVPALAFTAKFTTTPLGQHYKTLYDDGANPDFSIMFSVSDAKPMGGGKGYDMMRVELMEISSVTIPSNKYAATMKATAETYGAECIGGSCGCKHGETKEKNLMTDASARQEFLDDIECTVVSTMQWVLHPDRHRVTPASKSAADDLDDADDDDDDDTAEQLKVIDGALQKALGNASGDDTLTRLAAMLRK